MEAAFNRYAVLVSGNQNRAFGDPLAAAQPGVRFAETFWRPPADVCESTSTIVVTVDLAGIDQDELDVVLFEDTLIVEGRRRLWSSPRIPNRRLPLTRSGPYAGGPRRRIA